MTFKTITKLAIAGAALMAVTACSAISSLDSASQPLNTFELDPLPAGAVDAPSGRRQLEVSTPTATGALTSDRIVVKPTPLQVEYLPDVRWVDETTDHIQLLLVRSLANSGQFGLVSAAGEGPTPDFVLKTDLQAFHVELNADTASVVIRTNMTLLRDEDGSIVSSRSFANTVPLPDTTTELVVAAFNSAMTQQMTDMTRWLGGLPGV